jgi:hypothetical protein
MNEVASSTEKTSEVTAPVVSEPAPNATTIKRPQTASHSGSPDTSGKKAPPAQGAGNAAASSKKLKIVEKSDMIGALNPPSIATGDGLLGVSAEVVGRVYLNDEYVGETPLELRLAADTYRVRVTNKKFGSDSTRIRVAAGRRILWTAAPK